jgi:hypothetical protein
MATITHILLGKVIRIFLSTGVFNKYIAFLNKNSYFSINHQTSENASLAQNGTNQCGKNIAASAIHQIT